MSLVRFQRQRQSKTVQKRNAKPHFEIRRVNWPLRPDVDEYFRSLPFTFLRINRF
jgi:hypothetical protein